MKREQMKVMHEKVNIGMILLYRYDGIYRYRYDIPK